MVSLLSSSFSKDKVCLMLSTCCRRFLGGKLGAQIQQQFGLEYVGELTNIPIKTLEQKFGSKTGSVMQQIPCLVPWHHLVLI